MNAFFADLPPSLEEAALVDGASRWTAFRKIAVPLVLPGIATTAILCLVFSWNDYAFASTFSGPDSQTLPIAASQLVTQTEIDWGQLTAIGTIVVAPMIVVGLVVRKWLVTGLTLGRGDRRVKAAVLHAPGEIRIEERERPEPGPREVLVQITAVGVCGSDVHYYEHGRIGPYIVEAPLVLGHESAGRVVELGEGVTKHAVGDRVTLEPGVPCGRCRECRAGRYNLCADVVFFATPPVDGAFAEFVPIHEDFAFALPDELSDEEGALMEPLSVGVWACQKAGVSAGDRVLVTGAGPIGQLAMQCARAFGATEVTVSDVNPHRLELARRTGATRTVTPDDELDGDYDALIECSGHPGALTAGIKALRPAGTAVLVGMGPGEEGTLPLSVIQGREIWVTGTFRYANTYPTAIALAATGRVDLKAIMSQRFGLDETDAALRAGREDPESVKPLVLP